MSRLTNRHQLICHRALIFLTERMDNLKREVLNYLERSPLIQENLLPLKNGAVILINIENQYRIYLRRTPHKILVQTDLQDFDADVEFLFKFEAVRYILALRDLNLTDFAIEMIKQASLDNLSLRVHKSFLKLMRLGYFNILNQAGAPFWNLMAEYGLGSISKINQLLQKLRT